MPRGKTTSKLCDICNKDVSLFAYRRHVTAHHKKQQTASTSLNSPFIKGHCKFCNKEFTNKSGLSNHQTRCVSNPNRVLQVRSPEGRQRASEAARRQRWTDLQKQIHSERMKRAVENNPESYTSANRGRTKQIMYDGVKFQGQWELDFYKWAVGQGLQITRPTTGFKYIWNGERTYFPDFYISDSDTYIEVKGYETQRDRAKWEQFPKKLHIIREHQIKQIRRGTFNGLDQ